MAMFGKISFVLALTAFLSFQVVGSTTTPELWVWISASTEEALAEVKAHSEIVGHASYGGYSVTSNGTFAGKNNANISDALKDSGVARWPLIGGGSTKTLRKLFANADEFIHAAVAEIQREGFEGYNIDFEPYDGESTNADGLSFGIFLTKFADALHQVNKKLSVDFFSNLPFWDLGALNSSTTDYLISMDTYVPGNATFEAYLQVAQGHISGSNIGLGMCTGTRPAPFTPYGPDPCGLNPWTAERLTERFNALTEKLLKAKTGSVGKPFAMLNLWVLPLPAIWWKYLEEYYKMWGDMGL